MFESKNYAKDILLIVVIKFYYMNQLFQHFKIIVIMFQGVEDFQILTFFYSQKHRNICSMG